MDVSPNAVRKQTFETLKDAESLAFDIKNDQGLDRVTKAQILASLLVTKAQCLNTLVLLNEKKK